MAGDEERGRQVVAREHLQQSRHADARAVLAASQHGGGHVVGTEPHRHRVEIGGSGRPWSAAWPLTEPPCRPARRPAGHRVVRRPRRLARVVSVAHPLRARRRPLSGAPSATRCVMFPGPATSPRSASCSAGAAAPAAAAPRPRGSSCSAARARIASAARTRRRSRAARPLGPELGDHLGHPLVDRPQRRLGARVLAVDPARRRRLHLVPRPS